MVQPIKINGPGGVSTIVDGTQGKQDKRIMFCPEMLEIFFMDVGQGQLQNGRAYITLDPIFAKNIVVNSQHSLRVIIQLEDECNGVRVTNKSQKMVLKSWSYTTAPPMPALRIS